MNNRMLDIIAKANVINKVSEKKDKLKTLSEREKADSTIVEQINSDFETVDIEAERERIEERLKEIAESGESVTVGGKYSIEDIKKSKLPEPIKKAQIEAILEREKNTPVKKIIKENKETPPKKEAVKTETAKTKVDLEELFGSTSPKKNDVKDIIKETVKSTLKELSSDVEDGGIVKIVIKNKILVCKVLKVQDVK